MKYLAIKVAVRRIEKFPEYDTQLPLSGETA